MQDNYEEDLSEKEKAIVREMCNVITPLSNSRGVFLGPLLEVRSSRGLLGTSPVWCEIHRPWGRVEALWSTALGVSNASASFTTRTSLSSADTFHSAAFKGAGSS